MLVNFAFSFIFHGLIHSLIFLDIDHEKFDFIIIGGGSAGSVLARRLTEIESFKVLLLEAGDIADQFTDVPGFSVYTPFSPYNWGYKTVPQKMPVWVSLEISCNYLSLANSGSVQ